MLKANAFQETTATDFARGSWLRFVAMAWLVAATLVLWSPALMAQDTDQDAGEDATSAPPLDQDTTVLDEPPTPETPDAGEDAEAAVPDQPLLTKHEQDLQTLEQGLMPASAVLLGTVPDDWGNLVGLTGVAKGLKERQIKLETRLELLKENLKSATEDLANFSKLLEPPPVPVPVPEEGPPEDKPKDVAPEPPAVDPRLQALFDEKKEKINALQKEQNDLQKELALVGAGLALASKKLKVMEEAAKKEPPKKNDLDESLKKSSDNVNNKSKEAAETGKQAEKDLERARQEEEAAQQRGSEELKRLAALKTRLISERVVILKRIELELPRENKQAQKELADHLAFETKVLAEIESLGRRIEIRDKVDSARDSAMARFDELRRKRQQAGEQARQLRRLSNIIQKHLTHLIDASDRLRQDAARLRELADANPGDERKAMEASVSEAMRDRFEAHKDLLETRLELHQVHINIATTELSFAKRSQMSLMPLLPEGSMDQNRTMEGRNLSTIPGELTDLYLEGQELYEERLKQIRGIFGTLMEPGSWLWVLKMLLLLAVLTIAVRQVKQRREEFIQALSERFLKQRRYRRYSGAIVKALDVLRVVIEPLALLIAALILLSLFPENAPTVVLLGTIVRASLMYVIAINALRALILPRWWRTMDAAKQEHFLTTEPAEDLRLEELQRALFIVATVRLLLLYTTACQITLYLVREALGLFFLGHWIHILGYMGYAVVIYLLLSRWRETIAAIYTKLVSARSGEAVSWVNAHKDKFYGILIIFVAFLYVLALESWHFVERRLADLDIIKKLRNIAFRRRLQIEERLEGEESQTAAPAERAELLDAELIKVFSAGPVDESLILHRDEYNRFSKVLDGWLGQGAGMNWFIVGESGQGKTLCLEQLERFIAADPRHTPMKRHDCQRTTSARDLWLQIARLFDLKINPTRESELIQALLDKPPQALLLDNAHRLFLRHLGGFGAFESLQRLMNTTYHHHLWVLTFDGFAWTFLRSMQRKPITGPNIIKLEPWGDDELRQLIELRQKTTNWRVSFERFGGEEGSTSDEVSLQQSTSGYFRLLEEASRGNPRHAMLFWLESLVPQTQDKIQVHLFQAPTLALMAGLGDEHRFLLAALLQHTRMTLTEMATVVDQPESRVLDLLLTLEDKGLVTRNADGHASLVPRSYNRIFSTVRDHNLLHL